MAAGPCLVHIRACKHDCCTQTGRQGCADRRILMEPCALRMQEGKFEQAQALTAAAEEEARQAAAHAAAASHGERAAEEAGAAAAAKREEQRRLEAQAAEAAEKVPDRGA